MASEFCTGVVCYCAKCGECHYDGPYKNMASIPMYCDPCKKTISMESRARSRTTYMTMQKARTMAIIGGMV